MMLVSPQLRVVPVTVHVSLRKALETLTTDRIVTVAETANAALKRDFGIESPRLAIAGLNPHAGEQGLMGEEEITIIRPAIERLHALGIDCQGPFPRIRCSAPRPGQIMMLPSACTTIRLSSRSRRSIWLRA